VRCSERRSPQGSQPPPSLEGRCDPSFARRPVHHGSRIAVSHRNDPKAHRLRVDGQYDRGPMSGSGCPTAAPRRPQMFAVRGRIDRDRH
jgi:hypothetical protein